MGGNGVDGIDVSANGGNDVLYNSAPCSTAWNIGIELNPSNSQRDDDFSDISKSWRIFTNERDEPSAKRSRP